MKLALLGDVHGNLPALQAVLRDIEAAGIQEILVTGDIVGYYFWPVECLEAVTVRTSHIVRGNHEDMLMQARNNHEFAGQIRERYGSGIEIALQSFDETHFSMIEQLPVNRRLTFGSRSILLCHGSPRSTTEYVYPDASRHQLESMVEAGISTIVYGHTHYPVVFRLADCCIINPGSVGQPRDGSIGAVWAVYDTVTGDVENRLSEYDVGRVVWESKTRHPGLPSLHRTLLGS